MVRGRAAAAHPAEATDHAVVSHGPESPAPAPGGPRRAGGALTAVLGAFESGARSLDEISRRCALSRDIVDAAVEQLVRLGRLEAGELAIGCPSGGCGGCASGHADGSAGCGARAPGAGRTGPVLVTLRLPRPS